MGSRRKPWTNAQIRRVVDSIYCGGYAAYRSRLGWSIWLSGDGAGPSRRRFFIPEKSLSSRHPRWLGNRLTAAYLQALDGLEGVQMISGTEARDLLRWCTRRSRTRPPATANRSARAAKFRRWWKKVWRVPETVQGGWYSAERSRRGWVVRISTYSGRVRGNYLVRFRALRPHGRDWHAEFLVASLERALGGIEGAVRTDDLKGSSPTGWPTAARAPIVQIRSRLPQAGEGWTRRQAS